MSNPIILIPVHKQLPTDLEVVSLRQCGRCLARKAVVLSAPAGVSSSVDQDSSQRTRDPSRSQMDEQCALV